jgi:hypothetical protein
MKTPAHISWTSINLLHYVIDTYDHLLALDGLALPTVQYRGKIKLHGKNMSIQIHKDGVFPQSRGDMLTLPSGDLNGFAAWVLQHSYGKKNSGYDHLAYFQGLTPGITIFGEWCGPGVQKRVAISKHDNKVFAVFALQVGYGEDARIVYDPEEIASYLNGSAGWMPKEMYILPWFGDVLELDYADKESFAAQVAKLNEAIHAIEAEDPWVKDVFGISGMGEGIVFYPIGKHASSDADRLGRTMFKAKGVKHSKVKTREAVVIAPEVIASVEGFVDHMVTDNRLEQAVEEACGGEIHMRHTKAFIDWLTADVEKEGEVELAKAGLEWDSLVIKAVQSKARTWLREKAG